MEEESLLETRLNKNLKLIEEDGDDIFNEIWGNVLIETHAPRAESLSAC